MMAPIDLLLHPLNSFHKRENGRRAIVFRFIFSLRFFISLFMGLYQSRTSGHTFLHIGHTFVKFLAILGEWQIKATNRVFCDPKATEAKILLKILRVYCATC